VKHVTRARAIAAAGAASLLAVAGVLAASAASASVHPTPARVALAGSQTTLATPRALQKATPRLPARITASVYLAGRNTSALNALAQAISTPGNAQYGHFLTAQQAIADFAPSAAEATAVANWARSQGLAVGQTTSGFGAYVQVTGTSSAIAHAFSVTFGSYRVGEKKSTRSFWAPESAASVPSSIAGDVMTVSGLDSVTHQMKPSEALPPPGANYYVAPTCSHYYGQFTAREVADGSSTIPTVNGKAQPWTNCGYTPAQIRGAYNVGKSGETGKGVTVAVIDAYASPTMLTDANLYAKATGDRQFRSGQYRQVLHPGASTWDLTADPTAANPNTCGASGWYGEESLDVESVHGMAPDANVVYVGASDCTDVGLGNAIAYVVNTHAASIVTNSWGETADSSSLTPVYELMFKAAATEGIGFFFSAGDGGYEDPNYEAASDGVQVDYPTSSSWVTSVGGTSLAISKTNSRQFETGWGTILDPLTTSSKGAGSWALPVTDVSDMIGNGLYDGGTGGGVSAQFTQPWYQKPVVPARLARTNVAMTSPVFVNVTTASGTSPVLEAINEALTTSRTAMRVIPDVSALADPSTGFAVGETLFGATDSNGNPIGPEKFHISRIGGTSLATPVFAGIEADAQQAHGKAIGFANPAIYALDALNGKTHAFNDVTDTPGGQHQYEVRSNYSDPYNLPTRANPNPLSTFLRLLGANGFSGSFTFPVVTNTTITNNPPTTNVTVHVASALNATTGYDDETGVGSPSNYISAFRLFP
jgi:subtilase family serine protease